MTLQDVIVLAVGQSPPQTHNADIRKAGFRDILMQQAGESVRDAFRRALALQPGGIVTVDWSEGWSVGDVARLGAMLIVDEKKLYVGEPKESSKPSWVENLYSFLSGVRAGSALTSLFAMSAATASVMADMKSGEDTFLMNIPLEARADAIEIEEVQETDVTVPAPAFSLLTKSFKLYYVFIKFSIAAMIAYLVDIGTFGIFEIVFGSLTDEFKILWSTILSRILCSVATYFLNRGAVFRSTARQGGSVVRFLILSAAQLILSWLLVWWLGSLLGGSDFVNMILKVVVDFVIFMASFTIMRDWVFQEGPQKHS